MPTNIKLDRGSAFDGDAIVQGGIGNYVYMINKDEWDANQLLTFDEITNEITALTLKAGAQGWKFESSKGSAQIIVTNPFRGVSAIDGFDHSLDIRIVEATQLCIDNAKKLRFQKVVVIIPLLDGRKMVYGRRVGLRMSDWQASQGDGDTGSSFQVVLKTPENDPPEIDPPHYISSDYDITELDSVAT